MHSIPQLEFICCINNSVSWIMSVWYCNSMHQYPFKESILRLITNQRSLVSVSLNTKGYFLESIKPSKYKYMSSFLLFGIYPEFNYAKDSVYFGTKFLHLSLINGYFISSKFHMPTFYNLILIKIYETKRGFAIH